MAGQGKAGTAWLGAARQRLGSARQGLAWRGLARQAGPMKRRPALPNPRLRPAEEPAPGWWMLVPLVRDGPPMPARIFWNDCEPDTDNILEVPFLDASIGLERVPPDVVWQRRERPISEPEWKFRVAELAWLRQHEPSDPRTTPRAPVNLNTMEPLI